jgi:hypothetical protein
MNKKKTATSGKRIKAVQYMLRMSPFILFVQGDQKVSVQITVQKIRINILNSFSHLPW